MEFSVSRRGAAVVSAWFVLAGALVSLPFWRLFFQTTLLCLMAWALLCFALLIPHFSACTLRVGAHHLTLRRGILFLITRRVPLRFVTGCFLLRTPLQRLTGTCCLLLFTSGSILLVAGAGVAEAEALCARLTQGGRVL